MCRISIKRKSERSRMSHGGIKTETLSQRGLHLTHDWLPIQTDIHTTKSPIISKEGTNVLFNGELFGHDKRDDMQLIESLLYSGGTQDLLHYIKNKADGFWSFIIQRGPFIMAFTDPLGKKQLYYKKGYGIASEIRDLVDESDIYDKKYIAHTIKFGYTTDDSTPYENIKRLLPNKMYTFNNYIDIVSVKDNMVDMSPKRLDDDGFFRAMQTAVSNRLIGHHKVALLLSGGLDSSIIHYHLGNNPIQSYTVDNLDDLEYAEMVDPETKTLDIKLSTIDVALEAMEMPVDLGSMLPQYELMQAIEETVVMTGDGADEVFGGYNRMSVYDAQYSDVFEEIPFYHNIRLDRMASWFTKEIRSPFLHLDIVRHGLSLPYEQRVDKAWLRHFYKGILPHEITNREKKPLKTDMIRQIDPIEYRSDLVERFLDV